MSEKFLDEDEDEITLAMTRPQMIGGFSLNALVFSLIVPAIFALLIRQPAAFVLIPLFLGISYLICLEDVYLFDIFWAAATLRTCPNKKYWGCRTYAPR